MKVQKQSAKGYACYRSLEAAVEWCVRGYLDFLDELMRLRMALVGFVFEILLNFIILHKSTFQVISMHRMLPCG